MLDLPSNAANIQGDVVSISHLTSYCQAQAVYEELGPFNNQKEHY